MKSIALFFITLYQHTLAHIKPGTCMYDQSCSEYTKKAIEKYGVFRGGAMGVRRIVTCHPWRSSTSYFDAIE